MAKALQRTGRIAEPSLPRRLTAATPADEPDHDITDEASLWQLDFTGAELRDRAAETVEIEQCRFENTDLSGCTLARTALADCEFTGGNMANLHTRGSSSRRVSFDTVRMTGMQWTDGILKDVRFAGCRLDLSGFRFTKLQHVLFTDCKLSGVDLTEADLSGARFTGCDLSGAKLHHATMTGTRLEHCVLDDIGGAEALRGATVTSADLLALTYSLAQALGITVEHDSAGRP